MELITFDKYYEKSQVNKFMEEFKNNYGEKSLRNREFVSILSPYRHYVKIRKTDLPVFLKYDKATSTQAKNAIVKIIPLKNSEEYKLKRRNTDADVDIGRFIENEAFAEVHEHSYAIAFRYKTLEQMLNISKDLKIDIYDLGRQNNSWNLALGFDKGIKQFIHKDYILLEKESKSKFKRAGSFEQALNFNYLRASAFKNKTMQVPYFNKRGKYINISAKL